MLTILLLLIITTTDLYREIVDDVTGPVEELQHFAEAILQELSDLRRAVRPKADQAMRTRYNVSRVQESRTPQEFNQATATEYTGVVMSSNSINQCSGA
jgi:hypothetical protein